MLLFVISMLCKVLCIDAKHSEVVDSGHGAGFRIVSICITSDGMLSINSVQ